MVLPVLIPLAGAIASQVLPSLVTKLGGKRAGAVAEEVVAVTEAVVGSKDPEAIEAALRSRAAIKAQLRIRLAEIDQREDERILEDRLSARQLHMTRAAAGRGQGRANVMLAFAFTGLAGCVAAVVWPSSDMAPTEVGLITTVAGVLLKMVSDAFAFEFGSSQGSNAKDEQIAAVQSELATFARERAEQAERQVRVVAQKARDAVVEIAEHRAPVETFAQRLRRGAI
jgi:hypothetical protein